MHWIQTESGGVDTQLLSLLRNWPDPNDQFVLLYNADNQGYKRISTELQTLGVTTKKLPSAGAKKNRLKSIFKFLLFPIYFFLLKVQAKHELQRCGSFDALLVQNGCYPGAWKSLAALWAAHELRISKRMLIIHHGALHNNILRRPGESLLDYMMYKWATDIVAVSRATRQTLIDYRGLDPSKNPIRVIHNGVDRKTLNNNEAVSLREKFNVGSNQVLIGMVGRIERYKGHEDLLLALGEMNDAQKRRFFVLFIGSGEDEEIERLMKMAEQLDLSANVIFSGYLPGDSVDIIAQLDLLLMLTKDFEGFGLTIAEAMFAGTPVIATAVGAVPEFVNDDIAVLVHPESPEDIAKALLAYLLDAKKYGDRAKRAEKHIKAFSGEEMSRKYHRLVHLP